MKPTRKHIHKILERRMMGFNDKRKTYNRIKLTEKLSYDEQEYLYTELVGMFPKYRFCVGNIICGWMNTVVTAIKFQLK